MLESVCAYFEIILFARVDISFFYIVCIFELMLIMDYFVKLVFSSLFTCVEPGFNVAKNAFAGNLKSLWLWMEMNSVYKTQIFGSLIKK